LCTYPIVFLTFALIQKRLLMHNTNLTIGNHVQPLSIEPQGVTAQGGAESPCLSIPFSVTFTPPPTGQPSRVNSFTVTNISAQLHITKNNFRVSQTQLITAWHVQQSNKYTGIFPFLLTAENLFYIEQHREADLPASLQITVQVAMHESLPSAQKNGYTPTFIRDFETGNSQQYFTIPQSQWVNTLLPKLGYQAGTLLEIPAASILLPQEYALAHQELQTAHRYFIANDYDKTVAHCRSAIEPIKKEFPKAKPGITSNSRFAWLKAQYSATYDFIDAMLDANYTISNKGHHPPSTGNFGRNEATAILGITSQLIAYFGTICPDLLPPATPI
jgi:hypothetical protein